MGGGGGEDWGGIDCRGQPGGNHSNHGFPSKVLRMGLGGSEGGRRGPRGRGRDGRGGMGGRGGGRGG